MPKDPSIKKVLVIGAGPIIIGQGCEFDYSGTQSIIALKEEGCFVILINSNPATIMTDPSLAHATYIEPINQNSLLKIIEKERPDALLPTMGGQTALNCTLNLAHAGILKRYNIKLIGVSLATIEKAENRQLFKILASSHGINTASSRVAYTFQEALNFSHEKGFPLIARMSYTLGGEGSCVIRSIEELNEFWLKKSKNKEPHGVFLEQSLIGWKEYELEVMGDKCGNGIIVCSIENVDPIGVHTGDSITVAPAQTLSDKEYQFMRDTAFILMRALEIKTGGFNVQFALNPHTGQIVVIEVNPRVSRSSALASKATGFPIAKIATKLALGYTLNELNNEITQGVIPASFEPTLDYIVTKIPRFNFDKFKGYDPILTTHMKSVGEVMAIGRSFQESLQKALQSLDLGLNGFNSKLSISIPYNELINYLKYPTADRILYIADAFRIGMTLEEINKHTHIDPWFLKEIQDIIQEEQMLHNKSIKEISLDHLKRLKEKGFSDARLGKLLKTDEKNIRDIRTQNNLEAVFKKIDSCSGEFNTQTSYFYSTYEKYNENIPNQIQKILIIGSGPNRIGQGIEFDYCCVHAVKSLKRMGYETIMVNCNPSTVSTDYSVADRLYFEPLTCEHLYNIIKCEKPDGVVVQCGGQTPLHLSNFLEEMNIPLLGITTSQINTVENRQKFQKLLKELGLQQPNNSTFTSENEGRSIAEKIGYPFMLRPSYILGGSGISLIQTPQDLEDYFKYNLLNGSPILIEEFLERANEIEVDAVTDGNEVVIGGIMQQFEPAGTHSGDSFCVLTTDDLSNKLENQIYEIVLTLARSLKIKGFLNVQLALKNANLYILEVNPRASRTIPYVSKATGIPLVELAIQCMLGKRLKNTYLKTWKTSSLYAVKAPVFSFKQYPLTNIKNGAEMKSTGEIMGIGKTLDEAYWKTISEKSNNEKEMITKYHSKNNLLEKINIKLPISTNVYCIQNKINYSRFKSDNFLI